MEVWRRPGGGGGTRGGDWRRPQAAGSLNQFPSTGMTVIVQQDIAICSLRHRPWRWGEDSAIVLMYMSSAQLTPKGRNSYSHPTLCLSLKVTSQALSRTKPSPNLNSYSREFATVTAKFEAFSEEH